MKVFSGALLIVSYRQFQNIPTGATITHTDPPDAECVTHGAQSVKIRWAEIWMTPRGTPAIPDGWFTQDNSRRQLWENCPYNGFEPAYTCSKKHDFGSSYTHELGHAIGRLAHPSEVDRHNGFLPGGGPATDLADCNRVDSRGDPLWRATMCESDSAPGGFAADEYRSERRKLDPWDIESLRQQHARW